MPLPYLAQLGAASVAHLPAKYAAYALGGVGALGQMTYYLTGSRKRSVSRGRTPVRVVAQRVYTPSRTRSRSRSAMSWRSGGFSTNSQTATQVTSQDHAAVSLYQHKPKTRFKYLTRRQKKRRRFRKAVRKIVKERNPEIKYVCYTNLILEPAIPNATLNTPKQALIFNKNWAAGAGSGVTQGNWGLALINTNYFRSTPEISIGNTSGTGTNLHANPEYFMNNKAFYKATTTVQFGFSREGGTEFRDIAVDVYELRAKKSMDVSTFTTPYEYIQRMQDAYNDSRDIGSMSNFAVQPEDTINYETEGWTPFDCPNFGKYYTILKKTRFLVAYQRFYQYTFSTRGKYDPMTHRSVSSIGGQTKWLLMVISPISTSGVYVDSGGWLLNHTTQQKIKFRPVKKIMAGAETPTFAQYNGSNPA